MCFCSIINMSQGHREPVGLLIYSSPSLCLLPPPTSHTHTSTNVSVCTILVRTQLHVIALKCRLMLVHKQRQANDNISETFHMHTHCSTTTTRRSVQQRVNYAFAIFVMTNYWVSCTLSEFKIHRHTYRHLPTDPWLLWRRWVPVLSEPEPSSSSSYSASSVFATAWETSAQQRQPQSSETQLTLSHLCTDDITDRDLHWEWVGEQSQHTGEVWRSATAHCLVPAVVSATVWLWLPQLLLLRLSDFPFSHGTFTALHCDNCDGFTAWSSWDNGSLISDSVRQKQAPHFEPLNINSPCQQP